ncbi:MAG: CDP-alcohol phosphatidyltransferase [Actinobacteria bacterium]|nr:MAG: CDP-alcohol phosphatidyltransferase [Actinomycetota bacterium]
MTLAVLLPAASAGELRVDTGRRLSDRLAEQLRAAGADEVIVAEDLDEVARLADQGEPLLLCGDDLLAHTAVLRHVATHPPVGATVALVVPDGDVGVALREERGMVTGVGADQASSGVFGDLLRVGRADLPALAAAARAAAEELTTGALGVAGASPLDRLLVHLAATETTIFAYRVRLLVARRVTDQAGLAAAEAEMAAVDSDEAELRLSVKERDDFFATYFVSTWSPWVTRLAARLRIDPSAVTAISVLAAIVAAGLFAFGGRPALVLGAVLLYLGFVLDCVDGQLARYTRRFSAFGGWLDTIADRAKEYIVYAGLAVGVERADLGNGWALGTAAMVLQTVRHMTDSWYGALHDEAVRRPRPTGSPGGGLGERLGRVSNRVQADTGSLSYWLKRTVVFPIGERWALIALTVALFNPLVSLVAVLVWSGLAFAYTLALRGLRARSMRVPVLATVDASLHRDDGPVARLLGRVGERLPLGPLPLAVLAALAAGVALLPAWAGQARIVTLVTGVVLLLVAGSGSGAPHSGPLDWLVPAALRAAEYLFVIAVASSAGIPPLLAFVLLFVVILHHYDLTARLEKRAAPRPLHVFSGGWDGRIALLCAAIILSVVDVALVAMTGYLFLMFVAGSITGWTAAESRPSPGLAAGRELTSTGGGTERRNR